MDVARRQPPTVRLRRLAAELLRLRGAAGLSRLEAAERTDINQTTLWKIETARARPQRRTLTALLNLYGVNDQQHRTALIDLAKHATQPGLSQAEELPEEYATFISFEGEAFSQCNYQTSFVPGLLQTEEYARASIGGMLPLGAEEVEQRIGVRMQRQAALKRDEPLKLWTIVDEAALHRQVGGQRVMADQLQYLVELARQPQVEIQVLPFGIGVHPGMHGAFAILDFPDPVDPALIYVEHIAGSQFLERATEVRLYREVFERLRAAALNPNASVDLIAELAGRGEEV